MLRAVSVGFVLLGWICVNTAAFAVSPLVATNMMLRQTVIGGGISSAHASSSSALGVLTDPTSMIEVTSSTDIADTIGQISMLLAETEAWVQPLASFLDISLNVFSFAMLCRVVLSWYPNTKITDFPWIAVVLPTEPLLRAVKGVIPPAFGVDVTPVFWLAIFTFVHEILVGQQGLLTLKIKYGI